MKTKWNIGFAQEIMEGTENNTGFAWEQMENERKTHVLRGNLWKRNET